MLCLNPVSPWQPRSYGSTLIEMLLVISVIAILSGLMIPAFNGIGQARSLEKARGGHI